MKSILICVAVLILSNITTGSISNPVVITQPTTSVTTEKPSTTSVTTEKPSTTSVTTEKPSTTSVTTEKPSTTSVTTEKPSTTSVTTEKPSTTSVTTEKPSTPNVTTEKSSTPNVTTEKPSTPNVTTEKPSTPNVTTEKPSTPNVTTEKPSTPNVTTEKPSTPNVTTEKPSTPNVTTEKPTTHIPIPKRSTKYVVTGANGQRCIVITTEISYKYSYKNISENGSIFSNATHNGTCNDTADELSIYSSNVHLDLVFAKNVSTKFLKKVVLSFGDQNLTDSKDNMNELLLKDNEYFICKSSKKITLNNSVITFSDLTLDIFRNATNTTTLGSRHICVEDMKTSSIVPIAVGAALAGLVITVLIAYLIGRKRSRRGYESV
ncbi:uncharacterized protein LOC106883513 [Octopus bimaculoides]|uniref:Lysosome-associated membrane glycoprotein 5 n=1 Tax=Octopus bimaculoides TaxID=37653 RepID=A0A0L8FGL6_OCTBM|nr:uncharacterized protein LOC106883513 [Octopus bimaculoides]|eukprot:XP_014790028.1 PREDICTED: flocculation protein FLO11-like [Octopus bimaculoides]